MIHIYPELPLCYLGISHKCFEILENRPERSSRTRENDAIQHENSSDDGEDAEGESSNEDDVAGVLEEDEADGAEVSADTIEAATPAYAAFLQSLTNADTASTSDMTSSSNESAHEVSSNLNLRLREILYYDDKVAIFRARHMKL